MTGHELVYVAAAALVAGGVLHVGLRLLRARRLLRTTPAADRRDASRVLNFVTLGYAAILAIGVAVGLATGSAAWGVGVVVVLSVLAMLGAVVVMLVLAVRTGRSP
jgi:ABC-type transporter Mla maintaining outer membrane lipid asymmetry permease subunit MlaE